MDVKMRRYLIPVASLLAGALVVVLLTFVVRPLQKDSAHVRGVLTNQGGSVPKGAQFELGNAALGWYTVNLTAPAVPPVRGDISVEMEGPTPLTYAVTSRFPPGLPILNRTHPWYQWADGMIKGLIPGDSISLNLRVQSPDAAGEYRVMLKNAKTGQTYLTMPLTFNAPAGEAVTGEPCH